MQFMDNYLGKFLYGSQNYGLTTVNSDEDYIILIREGNIEENIHEKIYPLNYFLYRLNKGDLECYEILFTNYKTLNPIFEEEWDQLSSELKKKIDYDLIQKSLLEKFDEHLDHIRWLPQGNKEKAYYNKKRLYWAIRVLNQYERIKAGEDFESSLQYNGREDLLQIKTITNFLTIKDFNELYKNLTEKLLVERERN